MQIEIFYRDNCKRSIECFKLLDELLKNDKYKNIQIKKINEVDNIKYAKNFNYFFIPAIFLNGKKYHEGAIGYYTLKSILDEAIK